MHEVTLNFEYFDPGNQSPAKCIQIGILSLDHKTAIFCLGDEILSVNGMSVQGMSHGEAISIFKNIKTGPVTLMVTRRDAAQRR